MSPARPSLFLDPSFFFLDNLRAKRHHRRFRRTLAVSRAVTCRQDSTLMVDAWWRLATACYDIMILDEMLPGYLGACSMETRASLPARNSQPLVLFQGNQYIHP
ncbi:hypothetical protein ZWY2020_003730 [Hordeum vulgare]|nr:hypothetical protein ZWY2020_003730 [Hordeum vulgare]